MLDTEKLKRRYEGCQSFLQEGCLFLSLCSIAEQATEDYVDILGVWVHCKTQGYIDENHNLTVDGQLKLLRDLTGKTWKREVRKELPKEVPDEMFTVEKWERAETGYTHFKRRFMDTLTNSQTVQKGVRTAYYCYSYEV